MLQREEKAFAFIYYQGFQAFCRCVAMTSEHVENKHLALTGH